MTSTEYRYPRLRAIDVRPIVQNGRQSVLLRDPLALSDKMLVVPQPLHVVLSLCDGTRENAGALSASLAVRHGLRVPPGVITQLLEALDAALLLDNAACAKARERVTAAYRDAPNRTPSGAGQSYPEDAEKLKRLLDAYLDTVDTTPAPAAEIRGLVSPHIDYTRGGPVYAQVWQRAADAARAADLVVILGTDHFAEQGWLTLTRQHYATPYGVLPTARKVVDALAEAVGGEAAFANELHHRSEHSVELAAVWLHHVRGGTPCEVVPVLCGAIHRPAPDGAPAVRDDGCAGQDVAIDALVEAFRATTHGRQVLVVAAADLAHAGPAFGGYPLDFTGRGRLKAADDALIERMRAGDAQGFLDEIWRVDDRNNVCGVPPIYLALRMLHPVEGELVAYDRCPADEQGTSLVSVCGIVFK